MKWRSFVPMVFVVLLFIVGAYYYMRGFVHQRSHGVILMIANGLDQEILNRARIKVSSRGQKLFLDRMPIMGGNLPQNAFLTVQGFESPAPDESAAATMLASGVKVHNGFTASTTQGQRLDSLMYRAQVIGRGTGLVTNGELTMPTPVSFYGYIQGNEAAEFRNAAELVDSSKINVILGGGSRYFRPISVFNEQGRTDGRSLEKEAFSKGYIVVESSQELEKLLPWRTNQCLGLFHSGSFYYSSLREGVNNTPNLSDMTRRSIELLQDNLRGYFLVVEGALIAQACRSNLTDLAVEEAIAFDEAVKTAVTYAGKESTIIVVCGYSYGALPISSELTPTLNQKKKLKSPEWLLGPGGRAVLPMDKQWLLQKEKENFFSKTSGAPLNPGEAVEFYRQARPTTSSGWLISNGFGVEHLGGVYSAADLSSKIENLFK